MKRRFYGLTYATIPFYVIVKNIFIAAAARVAVCLQNEVTKLRVRRVRDNAEWFVRLVTCKVTELSQVVFDECRCYL